MKIAMLAPFDEAIPPEKYGGIERVIDSLVRELVKRGHDITLICAGKPDIPCRVISIYPKPLRSVEPFKSDICLRAAGKFIGIAHVLELLKEEHFDLLHNHLGWRFLPFHKLVPIPMVSTIHNPVVGPLEQVHYHIDPSLRFISISNRQRDLAPELQYVATVYNGVDTNIYKFSDKHDGYFFFLGRVSREKGLKEAIEVVKRIGKQLIIAAQVDVPDMPYYQEIKSLIDEKQIVYIGEVNTQEKVAYLQKASALISPIQWEEPFGLVAIEAMSCGTPVLGMGRGAYPEIIEQGKQGFLATTVDELTEYAKQIEQIDRHACRTRVEQFFTVEKMADGYEQVYKKLLE